MTVPRLLIRLAATALAVTLLTAPPLIAADPAPTGTLPAVPAARDLIDSPMYRDPELPEPTLAHHLPEGTLTLWLRALDRPEAELRYRTADALARAKAKGLPGLKPALPALRRELDRPDQPPAVRHAVAQALIALDDRTSADALTRLAAAGDVPLRELIEPALARWDHPPARAIWRARLADPDARPRSLVLALRGLAAVDDRDAADAIRQRLLSPATPGPLLVDAAEALGRLRADGLLPDAERLADPAAPDASRLAAAALLARHTDEASLRLLLRLAEDPQPSVAARAVGRLLDLDPARVAPLVDALFARADPTLRRLGVEALRRRPDAASPPRLSARLSDPHPGVRDAARHALEELAARPDLRDGVLGAAMLALTADNWQSQEQAAVLVGRLGHRPAAPRLIVMLDQKRPEAALASAWALRKLAVPDTFPALTTYLEASLAKLREVADGNITHPAHLIDFQASQLAQLLGQQRLAKAEPLLRQFVPRLEKPLSAPVGTEARAAAIWALGRIRDGQPDAALARALAERLEDTQSRPPENPYVRWMAAVTLGRLDAKDAVPTLKKFCPQQVASFTPVYNACGWSLERLTGEKLVVPVRLPVVDADWFLVPEFPAP